MNGFILEKDSSNSLLIDNTADVSNGVNFKITGFNNKVVISKKVVLRNISILINGNNNSLFIGELCNLRGAIHLRQNFSSVEIGSKTTFVGVHLFAMEGKKISIGEDCMFSSGIYARTSDEHSIIDLSSNSRINPAKDILIGNHVWIGEGVTLSKGSSIPDHCIVGARSVVTKALSSSNTIYAGCPAVMVRCWVPDDWLLQNKRPLLHGREVLQAVLATWQASAKELPC